MKILESAEFREAWELWHQHRKEIKKKITPTGEKMQLKDLESWGVEKAIFAIERSIKNGWQGLFEPKDKDMPVKVFVPPVVVKPVVVEFTPEQQKANVKKLREMCKSGGLL